MQNKPNTYELRIRKNDDTETPTPWDELEPVATVPQWVMEIHGDGRYAKISVFDAIIEFFLKIDGYDEAYITFNNDVENGIEMRGSNDYPDRKRWEFE